MKIQNQLELFNYFNTKGRFEKFTNSNLIFGDTLNTDVKRRLQFDTLNNQNSKINYYRKAAYLYETGADTIVYFMYGTSIQDSLLSQLRIRSFKNGMLVDDKPIFDFNGKKNFTYDYRVSDGEVTFFSYMDNNKTHFFSFKLDKGMITNTTFIPDSIFRRLDYIPTIGQRVRIYDDFNTKKLDIAGKTSTLKGSIVKIYGGGKSCEEYMIIQLDKNPLSTHPFVVTSLTVNNETKLSKLYNDSLELRNGLCFEAVYWPIEKPVLIKNRVYVEYD